ncbi:MAG: SpoIIE family protein phosphatase [Marinospirillum sp.]|uniref:ATP-binding SpoIIE family protein phosphatase n=1 Tax=Marinospirillum sp. TaxID=2183934 RepID=UPI0019FC4B65|nr:SpoIIE family protein phosphatase [Marinospirillum sp.]MBE0505578.1 SpoIIE family protein phosphatase [Marinospirillum sp.]
MMPAARGLQTCRLLLVTDLQEGRSLAAALNSDWLEVELCDDPLQVDERLAAQPFDLLIFDLDLVTHLEAGWSLPVILLGQEVDEITLQFLFDLGVEDFLPKPVSSLSLSLKVRAFLKRVELSHLLQQQNRDLAQHVDAARSEAEMASYIFYNNLLDQITDSIRGFNRYLNSNSDFCGDLTLARYSPSGSIFVLHVDAMGHGLSATVTLLPVTDIFHSMVAKGYALPMIVREMNRKLNFKLPPDRFVAASLVEVDLLHEQVNIWNGGMPPIYLLDATGQVVRSFKSTHMALGILDNASFNSGVTRFPLPDDGGIFGCSDGLIDQVNAAGESFGAERLVQLLQESSRHSLMSSLTAALKEYSGLPHFDDDVSLYYLHFGELSVFLNQQQTSESARRLRDIDPFRWELILKGRQIGEQDVASQCNELLQNMGLPQPFCQRVFTVISELSNNAIDHGILGLSSSLKTVTDGFAEYYIQREQGMRNLTADDVLSISLAWQPNEQNIPCLTIQIQQTGTGFDADRVLTQPASELSGRGLLLVKRLSTSLEFQDGGRLALVTLE